MRPPRRKPHPRSLDALFPKPAVKRCPAGHRQTQKYRPGDDCLACGLEARRREQAAIDAATGSAEREEWNRAHPAPAVLEMRVGDTGRVIRFAIPRHLAGKRRRGPGRRRGI
jgi:hypothetical protein